MPGNRYGEGNPTEPFQSATGSWGKRTKLMDEWNVNHVSGRGLHCVSQSIYNSQSVLGLRVQKVLGIRKIGLV